MTITVRLQAVVDEMETAMEEMTAYIHRTSGELLTIGNEYLECAEDGTDDLYDTDWQQEMLADAGRIVADDAFIPLPDQYEIHEYDIMRRFCLQMEEDAIRNNLLAAISGKGAFRHFKDRIDDLNIREDWFAFKNTALKTIAADFLEQHEIAFVDE